MNRSHLHVSRVLILLLLLASAAPGTAQNCPTQISVDLLHVKVDALEAKKDAIESKADVLEAKLDALQGTDDDLLEVLHQAWEERLCALECTPLMWMPAANDGMLEEIRQWVSDQIDSADNTGDRDVDVTRARGQLGIGDGNAAAGRYMMACLAYARALKEVSEGCS